jgi:methyltransferase (TIGR00027 family)
MQTGQPSRTALGAAAHRATHQLLEHGRIFHDPLAIRALGQSPEALERAAATRPESRGLRLFIAARSRFAETAIAAAATRGVRQLVVLGAGLDTFAYRNPHAGLRVFEVDHPATQVWKRQRLADADIAVPESLRFAAVDFETVSLADGLAAAGFDACAPAIFSWLGVVPYLTEAAVFAALGFIAGLARGGEVVFTYSDPPATMSAEGAAAYGRRAASVAAAGEPWITSFATAALHARLRGIGFGEIEDLGPTEVAIVYFGTRPGAPERKGGHLVRARLT